MPRLSNLNCALRFAGISDGTVEAAYDRPTATFRLEVLEFHSKKSLERFPQISGFFFSVDLHVDESPKLKRK